MKAGWWTKLAGDECDLCELAAQGDSVHLRTYLGVSSCTAAMAEDP